MAIFTLLFLDDLLALVWLSFIGGAALISIPTLRLEEANKEYLLFLVAIAFLLVSGWRFCAWSRIRFELWFPVLYVASLVVVYIYTSGELRWRDCVLYALTALVVVGSVNAFRSVKIVKTK